MAGFSSLFCFLLLLTNVFSASVPQIDIPIYRRVAAVNGRMRARDVARAADTLRARYGYPTASSREQKRQSSDVPITNQDEDSSYFVAATFGTPPQSLNVVLGFATADTWVATPQCGNCSSTTPRFNSSKSSTYTTAPGSPQIIIQYTSANVSGVQSMDQVGMGQFTVPNQTFIAVNYTEPDFLTGSVSGVFGLAFASISTTNTNTFFQALFGSSQLAAPMMSFYLTRLKGTANVQTEAPGGLFTLGGTNPAYYKGSIDYQNFPAGINPSYWMLPVTGIFLDGVSKLTTQGMAALDVSSSAISGPPADVANFWAAVPGSIALTGINSGVYSFPCSTQINASMTFGGQVWPIDPADLNLGPAPGGGCVGGIVEFPGSSGPGSPTWILGSAFLKNVYTVLRASPLSIGFAEVADVPGRDPDSPLPSVPDKVGGDPFGANNGTSSSTSDRFGSSFLLVVSLMASVSVTVIGL